MVSPVAIDSLHFVIKINNLNGVLYVIKYDFVDKRCQFVHVNQILTNYIIIIFIDLLGSIIN